jgi:hypothetical protein
MRKDLDRAAVAATMAAEVEMRCLKAEEELKATKKRCRALEAEAEAAVELRKLLDAAKKDIDVKDGLIASDMEEIKRFVMSTPLSHISV